MQSRIAIWAIAGALVVGMWSIYITTTLSNPLGRGGVGRALLFLTCPIAIASNHPQSFYFVLIVNAATYALVGVMVEMTRRFYQTRSLSN
jgi:RsiW-degrading membrane proteinase PrsW (M82 family)